MRNDYLINRRIEDKALSITAVTEEYISKANGSYHIVPHTVPLSGRQLSDELRDKIKEEIPEDHVVIIVSKKIAENLRL